MLEIKNNSGNILIALSGRLDTAASAEVGAEINKALSEAGQVNSITVDAEELEFISSSGLRIVISLKKQCSKLSVINVSQEVFNVFDLTGFTKIIDIKKALRKVSIDGCDEIGRGGVGIVYKTAPDTIVKVFREGSPMEELEKEITMAKEAFVLGMPTAISFDIVKVGSQLGLVYEMLDAETLATAIRKAPERIDEYAVKFAHLVRTLHDIEVEPGGIIPDANANEMNALGTLTCYFTQEQVDKLMAIQKSIPQGNRLLHCDLHPKNVMLQGEELMLIDMGEVGYGNPLIDLAHTYSSMKAIVGDYEQIIGLTEEQCHRFYDVFIAEYYAGESAEEIERHVEEIRLVSRVRNFSWLSLSDNFPDEVIEMCREEFKKRIE